MEFKSFDEYIKFRLSQKGIDDIKKEAKAEFNEAMHEKYCCIHRKDNHYAEKLMV